jgi:hypothetical protein
VPAAETLTSDGQEVATGMHSGTSPLLLREDQVAWAWNTQFTPNYPTCRPAWRWVWTLDSTSPAIQKLSPATRTAITTGRFQGAFAYYPDSGQPHLLVAAAGQLFSAEGALYGSSPSGWHVRDFGQQFVPWVERVWGCQAENYLVLQDGSSRPRFYRDGNLRESGAPTVGERNEVTAGRAMAFANGRLWIASADGRDFMAGDITRGPSGNQAFGFRDAVLKKTENKFLGQGGRFAVPESAGEIVAFVQPAQADVPGNTGPVVILTRAGGYGLNLPVEREAWAALRSPPVTTLLNGEGCVGPVAFSLLNGDVMFRSPSGIRALRRGYRDLAQGWSSRIINFEMARVQAETQIAFLKAASAAFHNYRAFFTELPTNEVAWDTATAPVTWQPPANPADPTPPPTQILASAGFERGTAFSWLSSILTTPISTMNEEGAPAHEGISCGLRILQVLPVTVDGVPHLFVLALTQFNSIALYELNCANYTKDLSSPRTPGDYGTCEEVQIPWGLETRALFSKERLQRKRLKDLELGFTGIRESITVRVLYRPHGSGQWIEWGTKSIPVEGYPCGKTTLGCITGGNVASQARFPVRFGDPDDATCLDSQGRPAIEGFAFQLRIEVTGAATLSYLLCRAVVLPRVETYEYATPPTSPAETVCSTNEAERTYSIG